MMKKKKLPLQLLGEHLCMIKMPFGLMNAGATFQRVVYRTFLGENDKFIVIYSDDIIVSSQLDAEHLSHLR